MLNKALLFFSLISLFPILGQWNVADVYEVEMLSANNLGIDNTLDCRCRDSLALARIFKTTSGFVWKEAWDLESTIKSWKGVTLNNENCVAELILNNNGLLGFLPPELGDLSELRLLSLKDNQLQGNVPSVIGQLTNLESLDLKNNRFSGPIPKALGALTKLQLLDLRNNQLWGNIPEELGLLSSLSELFLNQNQLEGVLPVSLTKLNNLVRLDLSINELTGAIPLDIGDLSKLEEIALNKNQLTGPLPVSIGNLKQLIALRLENNELKDSLPSSWGNLVNIETIFLQGNDLIGCFPETFEVFCDLNNNASQQGKGYNFSQNSRLSWAGDFDKFCSGNSQMEADCQENSVDEKSFNRNCICPQAAEIPVIEINITEKATCKSQKSGSISGIISAAGETFRVTCLGVERSNEIFTDQSFEFENLGVGAYEITIFSSTNDSLIYTEKITITESDCFNISALPQLITPNGDGLNDAFIIDAILDNPTFFKDNSLTIFNRWGDSVFDAQPYNNDWSGQQQNGQLLPEGTYYYLLKIDLNEGLIYKGDITIVRK